MKKKILIVEDNIALSQRLRDRLERCGYAVETAIDEPSARRLIRKSGFDLVLADVRLPKGDGLSLLEWLNGGHRHVPFVVMTGYANYPDAVRAVKSGADDYLPKPVDPERLLDTVRELLRPSLSLPQGGKTLFRLGSPAAREVERMATLVAPVEVSVLILGANGTGKESVARRIHEESDRRLMPFVAVNCSVISKELAPSLLFGHAKGSFTGAEKDTEGYFGMAEGGTLFLDEIGTLGYEAQSMLLRVLQEGTYTPVGGNRERRVRIVAATNEDLAQGIRENRFREDLYHRLAEFEIHLPALRECRADILPLAGFFRERFSSELRKPTEGFTPAVVLPVAGEHPRDAEPCAPCRAAGGKPAGGYGGTGHPRRRHDLPCRRHPSAPEGRRGMEVLDREGTRPVRRTPGSRRRAAARQRGDAVPQDEEVRGEVK